MCAAEFVASPALAGNRIIPVYSPGSAAEAVAVAGALLRGGVSAIEVTLRTNAAITAIAAIAQDVPGMSVGAGTVIDATQLHQVRRAGASFAFSPGSTPSLLDAGRDSDLLYVPGVASGSDVMSALAHGYCLLKLFPAEPINARALLPAWQGPFAFARFCPTGGIRPAQVHDYLRMPNVPCLGGSWLTPADAIARADWQHIESLAREAKELATAV